MIKKLLLLLALFFVISPSLALDDGCSELPADYLYFDNNGVTATGGATVDLYDWTSTTPDNYTVKWYNVTWGTGHSFDYPQVNLYSDGDLRLVLSCPNAPQGACIQDNWCYYDTSQYINTNLGCGDGSFYDIETHIENDTLLINVTIDGSLVITNEAFPSGEDPNRIGLIYDNPPASYFNLTEMFAYSGDTCPSPSAPGWNYSAEYNSSGIASTQEDYKMILTMNEGSLAENLPEVYLDFNGTMYNATGTNLSSTSAEYYTNLFLPNVTINETLSFRWNVSWYNETANITNRSTDYYNMIDYQFILDNCSIGNTVAINFSIYNESTLDEILGTTKSTWYFNYLDLTKTFSTSSSTDHIFCIYPDHISMSVDMNMEYTATNYNSRSYYLDNYTLDDSTDYVSLYLLQDTESVPYKLIVRDINYKFLENTLVKLLRYYPESNTYNVVEISQTDYNGEAITHLDEEDVFYKFIVEYNGNTILSTSGGKIYPCLASLSVCEITLITEEVNETVSSSISTTFTYNNDTGSITLTYNVPSGLSDTVTLFVSQEDTIICNNQSTSNAGSIICDVSNYDNIITAKALDSNGHTIEVIYYDLNEYYRAYGTDGLFFLILAIITATSIGLAIRSIATSILLSLFMLGGFTAFGFVGLQMATVIGFIALGSFIMFKLRSP